MRGGQVTLTICGDTGQAMLTKLKQTYLKDERGSPAVEYGIIISLIFLALVAATQRFSSSNKAVFEKVETNMTEVHGGT